MSGLKFWRSGPGLLNFNELSNFSVHELSELVEPVRLIFAGSCKENPERIGVSSIAGTLASPTSGNFMVFLSLSLCTSTEDIPGLAVKILGAKFSFLKAQLCTKKVPKSNNLKGNYKKQKKQIKAPS